MSENEYREEDLQEKNDSSKEKTIDLVEWQRKNAAYLEKRAQEKASQKDPTDAEEDEQAVDANPSDLEESRDINLEDHSELEAAEAPLENESDAEEEEAVREEVDPDNQETSLAEEAEQEIELATSGELFSEELSDLKQKKTKRRVSKRQRLLTKVLPFFLMAGLALLAAAYTVLPISKQKTFKVTGQQHVSPEQVLAATGLTQSDYTLEAVLKKEDLEKKVADQLVWVDQAKLNYQFPHDFQVIIKEHYILGYVKDGMTYYPVLSSGDTIDEPVGAEALPTQFLLFKMTDLEAIRSFVSQLKEGELLDLVSRIQTVELSPTQASDDLLLLNMLEGHSVLVPLSEVAQKLVFYEGINKQLLVPSYIDMEAGVYTYAK